MQSTVLLFNQIGHIKSTLDEHQISKYYRVSIGEVLSGHFPMDSPWVVSALFVSHVLPRIKVW